jgi:hypothetical protein
MSEALMFAFRHRLQQHLRSLRATCSAALHQFFGFRSCNTYELLVRRNHCCRGDRRARSVAHSLIQQLGGDVTPWSVTPEIIVLGPYHFTRNPMYLMIMLVCFACAILFSEAWLLILISILRISLYHIAIKHEKSI